ncbi:glutamine amidotransferase-like class 1 domain-containing protein 1 [Hydra vulgaris]|nr:glutamine amidotransferase-like class 1 domain-containing protein 1 [Hydra vulgaris]
MTTKKSSCLIVCSGSISGVSAQSFIHSFTLIHSAFNVSIVTPNGNPIEFTNIDDNSSRWLKEFKSKPFSIPAKLEEVDASSFSAILIPSGLGCLYDLATSSALSSCLVSFMDDNKPICAVGHGVAGLCSAKMNNEWLFKEYSLTAPSLLELSNLDNFSSFPIILEDFIKDNDACYSKSKPNCTHVIIDRCLITGQNDSSTLSAVQNLILLCNARQGKGK